MEGRHHSVIAALTTGHTFPADHLAVVVAHPDDETIGIGGRLALLTNAWVLHVTDGAPENMTDASANGFTIRQDYAAARRAELIAAMDLAGISPARLYQLDIADQRATQNLPSIIARLAALFAAFDIEVVLTHPFEGGHPDHDATCLAVHAAAALLAQAEMPAPSLLEMAFYHADAKGLVVQRFPGEDDSGDSQFELDAEAWDRKQAMVEKFVTQRETLAAFRSRTELLRPAPRYDFSQMPNEGVLHYDRFDFGITGAQWQESARRALREYGLPPWLQDSRS